MALLTAHVNDPAIDVAEHVGVETVRGGIGVQAHRKTRSVKETEVALGVGKRDNGVGNAVADQDAQLTHFGQTQQRAAVTRHGPVETDNATETFGKEQSQAIGQACSFAEARQEYAFGMHMITPAGLFDGPEDVLLQQGPELALGTPTEAGTAIRPDPKQLGSTQADTDEIAPAQPRSQPQGLDLAAPLTVKEDQQRIGIVRFVTGRQESPDR